MNRIEKIAKANIPAYDNSEMYRIEDAYNKPSTEKRDAFMSILREMVDCAGWGLKVIHHNTFKFSCGYLFVKPETGVVKFKYFTKDNEVIVDY